VARATKKKTASKKPVEKKKPTAKRFAPFRWVIRWGVRIGVAFAATIILAVVLFAFIDPPTTPYMFSEGRRIGRVDHQWVDFEKIAPVMARSVVAAEDANFCLHWGFDMAAIRSALDDGSGRGASTISQQVVKNVFLWQGRSWPRKALEALFTPALEAVWTKRRILEVYLNVAEFGEGTFGIEAAAGRAFRVKPESLTSLQAARLAAVLPNPKKRLASKPTTFVRKRAGAIMDGAATIALDGRAECFES